MGRGVGLEGQRAQIPLNPPKYVHSKWENFFFLKTCTKLYKRVDDTVLQYVF